MKLSDKVTAGILKGIEAWPSLYITAEGRRVIAARLADVKKEMTGAGWRNVSQIDEIDCRESGLEVVEAYYGQRAHTVKRFCKVVVLRDAPPEKLAEPAPFNLALHEHLVAAGYVCTRHPDSFEDDGDAESGPHLVGGPAYDEYCGPDEYVFASADGTMHREARDLQWKEWVDQKVQLSPDSSRI